MKYVMLKLDREFHKEPIDIPEGTILELLSCNYQKDYQQYFTCFKEIGKPVDKLPSIQITYV